MPNGKGIDEILISLEKYFKAIEKFQSGSEVNISSDSLEKLENQIYNPKNTGNQSSVDPDYQSKSFSNFIDSINKVELTENVVPYTRITKLIYTETKYNRELYDMLDDIMTEDWDRHKGSNPNICSETIRVFLKIKDHIGLSILQRSHISDRMNEQLYETSKKLDDTEYKLKKLSELADNAHDKADKLVVQFITILGIFAAIMMGTMGSFQSFASIFSNAENIPIGKTLLISAAGASGVSLILFLLLHSISKLTSFGLSNCDCKEKRKGALQSIRDSITVGIFGETSKPKCTCSMFNKYPTIFIINYLFYYVAFTGFIFMYFNFNDYFNENFWLQVRVIFYFYFVATLILLCIHRYLINKNPNENSLRILIEDVKKTSNYIKELFQRNV